MKRVIILFVLSYGLWGYAQDVSDRKIELSVSEGIDFPVGKSHSTLNHALGEFTKLPLTSPGFGGTFDGVYYFRHLGIGLKYHYFKGEYNQFSARSYPSYAGLTTVLTFTNFVERSHFIGPAVYGRWRLGNPKLNFLANIGLLYVCNKSSNIIRFSSGHIDPSLSGPISSLMPPSPEGPSSVGLSGLRASSVALSVFAGLRWQCTSLIGLNLSINGFWSKVHYPDNYNISQRDILRLGFSGGISFSI